MTDTLAATSLLDSAAERGDLSDGAVENIRAWLTEPRYAEYVPRVVEHLEAGRWRELDDAFWTVIPFGTGGRRGRMYPIGSNTINDRTIGESAAGLARYVKEHRDDSGELSCAIALDTRHRSVEFSRLCAEVMVAEGFKVYLLDEIRSTPELSFLVRFKRCSCGIMVTASHNPPSDNAVKAYWSTGGQILPPHDQGVIDCVMAVQEIRRADFDEALAAGKIELCVDQTDRAFIERVAAQGHPGPRDLKIIYTPLHGVGATAVMPALAADGFTDVSVFEPHAAPDGDFPNVPGHVSNPENPAVFDAPIEQARKEGASLILATDPDCDRLGAAAPRGADPGGDWGTFTGNQLAALLTDYVLEQFRKSGRLTPDHYLVKTLVTTELMRRIGRGYGVKTFGDLLVGFKWIGGVIDRQGPDRFVLGAEESHGYLVGEYARDKDAAVACMLLSELAASLAQDGLTLHDRLDSLFLQHGYHAERLLNQRMAGSEGMARMQALMQKFRSAWPERLAGLEVVSVRDYLGGTATGPDGKPASMDGPTGDLVILDLSAEGNYVAVRPSGTEPKVKFYMFTFVPPELISDLSMTKPAMADRLDRMQADLQAFAETV